MPLASITSEQWQMIPALVQDWLDRFFEFEPTDREIKESVYELYRLVGLCTPEIMICESPFEVEVLLHDLKETRTLLNFDGSFSHWIRMNVIDYFKEQSLGDYWLQKGNVIEYINPWERKEKTITERVWRSLELKIKRPIDAQIKDVYYTPSIFPYHHDGCGDNEDFGWVAMYEFLSKIDIINDTKFDRFCEIIKQGGFGYQFFEHLCVVCKKPVYATHDPLNRLHNTDSHALEFGDGYKQHYVHGQFFTPADFQKFIIETPTYAEINGIQNVEQRTAVLMEKMDVVLQNDPTVKIIHETIESIDVVIDIQNGQNIIKTQEFPMTLYSFEFNPFSDRIFSRPREIHALLLHDHSTRKPNIHLVPNRLNTCEEALNWMWYGLGTSYTYAA